MCNRACFPIRLQFEVKGSQPENLPPHQTSSDVQLSLVLGPGISAFRILLFSAVKTGAHPKILGLLPESKELALVGEFVAVDRITAQLQPSR